MASADQRGKSFPLSVGLMTIPKVEIKPNQREQIYNYMNSQLCSYQSHLCKVEELDFFKVVGISIDQDTVIKLEFSVLDKDGLDKFFGHAKHPSKTKMNELSHSLTQYFHNQEMALRCGFQSKVKVEITVSMSDKERKMVAAELEKQETKEKHRNMDNTSNNATKSDGKQSAELRVDVDPFYGRQVRTVIDDFEKKIGGASNTTEDSSKMAPCIKMTFIIDVADKEVLSVHMKSRDVPELNCTMMNKRRNIYSVDVELPADYNPYSSYSYEIHLKNSVLSIFKYTKEMISGDFTIGNKPVRRDILWGVDSVHSHLHDIVHYSSDRYSESELCMQIEDICKHCDIYDENKIIKNLLNSGIIHSSKYLVRFAIVAGSLCKNFSCVLYKSINATVAHEVIDALLLKKLSDFPASCSAYMPKLCKHLFKIGYGKDFCVLNYLDRVSSFLSDEQLLSTLRDCLSSREKITDCGKLATDLCRSFYLKFLSTDSLELKSILECLFRHFPLETALSNYGLLMELSNAEVESINQTEEDALTAISASIRSQLLSNSYKALREKEVVNLLKMASLVGKFDLSSELNIQKTFEDGVIDCFSSYNLKETDLKEEVEDFLTSSGCFVKLESQIQLLKAISESRNSAVRRLFIVLNEDRFIVEAYNCLECDVYKAWLQNEIKTHNRNENEILISFRALCEIFKFPVVSEREEVKKTLEHVTLDALRRYTLKDMLQNIEKIEELCDSEPTVSSLYKQQVQELVRKRGLTPSEVLKLFRSGDILRVHTRTTSDIVCTITDLFFKKLIQEEMFEIFICQIPHVEFWDLISKGEGSRIYDVWNNETYKHVKGCLERVTFLLSNLEVDVCFMAKINLKDERTKKMLQVGGMKQKEIETMQADFKKMMAKLTKHTENVIEVLEEVRDRMSEGIPEISPILEKAEEIKKRVASGSLYMKEVISKEWLWGDLQELPEICNALQLIIKSNVFWNVTKQKVLERFASSQETGTPLDGLLSVRYLYGCETEDDIVYSFKNTEELITFLKTLNKQGCQLFEKHWTSLETDFSIPFQSVQAMFEKANVPYEITTAEKFLDRRVKGTVKDTLSQLWRKNEVLEKAKAMTSVLKVFGYDISKDKELNSALKSFQELFHQNFSEYTLKDIQTTLGTVFSFSDILNDDTVYIMIEVGKSSLLVDFLREIAIEDVRNLIDAVEDLSESHVQESIVSALIEVKRFLSPLLSQEHLKGKGSEWIFQTLTKQTSIFGKNATNIPEKIRDCSMNLHNLKSLYNNVANRGQQTKEIIKSIISKGKFAFMLCTELDRVVFEVSYKESKNNFIKQEATLSDIRSRALLLQNTERECTESSFNQEEFKAYIKSVDLCLEIRDILTALYCSGHIRYKYFKHRLKSSDLLATKDKLSAEYEEWMTNMYLARDKYYLMNFIDGSQIRVMSDYLEKGFGKNIVQAILHHIHLKLTVQSLANTYRRDLCLFDERLVLDELGRSLHAIYANLDLYHRDMVLEDFTPKITERVYKGKILVAHLEEKSDFVIRTVLALYRNTTHQFPEPNQLLFCTRETPWHEIELLLRRCKGSNEFYGSMLLYCLANVELLQNEVQFKLVEELQSMQTNCKDFYLTLVCRGSKNHPFVDQLNSSVVCVQPVSNHIIGNLFKTHFSQVTTYTSEMAGLGKTTSIYSKSVSDGRNTVTLHISGQLRKSELIRNLNELQVQAFHTLHFDIGVVDEPGELDTFLFELVVMKFVSVGKEAFYMPTEHVCFEIGNTINDGLRNNLTTVTAFKRVHLLWTDFADFICSQEMNSPVQVVCQYLEALDKGTLDRKDLCFSNKKTSKILLTADCRRLLKKHLEIASDISFSIVHIFLNVLSDQLKKLTCSTFFKVTQISEMISQSTVPTVRSCLVKAMIDVSMEFAARSVNACRSTQSSTLTNDVTASSDDGKLDGLIGKIIHRVDGMIRWEESNHLIYVFHNQNIQTLSPMYRDKEKVPLHVRELFESQMKRMLPDFSAMKQIDLQNMLQRVARTSSVSLTEKHLTDLSKDYALTPDNLLKMVLIMMRIQSNVPVVVMGETGCGKTSLIRYLANICGVPFKVMNIHAGISTNEIMDTILHENAECSKSKRVKRWLFLDEINTSENIGLICDVICHRRCNGMLLAPNLVVMGACNPYKLRSAKAIHSAGLTGKVKTDELSKLVYRVLPLPEMIVDYVWDFGSLSEKDEMKYIMRMVESVFANGSWEHILLSDLLSISQTYVRKTEKSTCVVSLRDVQRCKTLVPWFVTILKQKSVTGKTTKQIQLNCEIKAIILALAHCYHSRFVDKDVRKGYRKKLLEGFQRNKFSYLSDEKEIHEIIKAEQTNIIDRMDLPSGTAKNTALQENIFVILVCILNKIPVFVVGNPGCSKSLAMQIIRSNLRGKDATDQFFKTLPQLYCVSFQGSESSTSEGIIKVFEKAENYQKSNSKDSVLSVVILDEIGLAEVSRFNPLKVLHNLLEPEGKGNPNVAVVGISNWALDASKMNRAVHLSRPDMDEEELFETALSISRSFVENIEVHEGLSMTEKKITRISQKDIEHELRLVAKSYSIYTSKQQFKNFHGLRDFYSLVKFIARKLAKDFKNLTSQKKSAIIMEGLLRNFGGLKSGRKVLIDQFIDCFQSLIPECHCSIELIANNINDTIARHLMIITKGESVLGILEQNLRDSGRERKEIIFGSQFEEDLTDDYNYRILSRIILCMEQGIVLILKDLENIYGSLYDMLNQNYTRLGMKNNCRVALGPYSNPFCHVADSFRCIVLVDEGKVDYTDPPFLNRFEKQYLSFADVMTCEESKLVDDLESWLETITQIEGKPFTKYSAVPFYNEELMYSLALHLHKKYEKSDVSLLEECQKELLWIMRPEVIVRLPIVDDYAVQQSSEHLKSRYFQLPLHEGLGSLIHYQINKEKQNELTIVFTNSNIHTKISDELTKWHCQYEKLGTFKSEKQLSLNLQQFWNHEYMQILLVHCSAQDDDKHIMLTKSLIEKYREEYLGSSKRHGLKSVYLIIHLGCRAVSQLKAEIPSSLLQINYLSGWKLLLLESLEQPKISLPIFCSNTLLETIESMLPLDDCLKEHIFWTFTRIQYGTHGRGTESISSVLKNIQESPAFLKILGKLIWSYVQDSFKGQDDVDWFMYVACDMQALSTSAFLVDALEHHVQLAIKNPLAKIIYKLEQLGALDCYFIEDINTIERKKLWCLTMSNEKVFSYSVKDTPINDPTGPECYQCNTPDIGLKFPFSRVIFESIEDTKDLFLDEVKRSKVKCELEPDDSLPEEIMTEIILQQECFILKKLSDILVSDDMSECLMSDYISDFCNLFSYTFSTVLEQDRRIEYMRWTLQQKVHLDVTDNIQIFSSIHCAGWSNISLFGSVIQLLELCSNVFGYVGSNILTEFKLAITDKTSDSLLHLETVDSVVENLNKEFSDSEIDIQNKEENAEGLICINLKAPKEIVNVGKEQIAEDKENFDQDKDPEEIAYFGEEQNPEELGNVGEMQNPEQIRNVGEKQKSVEIGNVVQEQKSEEIGNVVQQQNPEEIGNVVQEQNPEEIGNFVQEQNPEEIGNFVQEQNPEEIGHVVQEQNPEEIGNFVQEQNPEEIGIVGEEQKSEEIGNFVQERNPEEKGNVVQEQNPEEIGFVGDGQKSEEIGNVGTQRNPEEIGNVGEDQNPEEIANDGKEQNQPNNTFVSLIDSKKVSHISVHTNEEFDGNISKSVSKEAEIDEGNSDSQKAEEIKEDCSTQNDETVDFMPLSMGKSHEPKTENSVISDETSNNYPEIYSYEETVQVDKVVTKKSISQQFGSENAVTCFLKDMHQNDTTQNEDKEAKIMNWSGDLIQDLVSFVCRRMIPRTGHYIEFDGVQQWQVTVRNVLIIAAEVSTDSNALHALRLCSDVVSDIIQPYNLDLALLQKIGNNLEFGNVDSEDVFSCLLDMFQHLEGTESATHVQRVICQFLIRCLSSSTDTKAYTYLFKAIKDRSIPENEMHLLKAPLRFLVQQDLAENENLLQEILSNHTEYHDMLGESSDFLQSLDSCLSSLFYQDRIDCPFVLLIVDIFEETFESDEDKNSCYELMLTCGRIMQEGDIGLTFITAVSYLKAAIVYTSKEISDSEQNYDTSSTLLTRLNAVLSGLEGIPVHRSLLGYFLKEMVKYTATFKVIGLCKNLSQEYPFLKGINWTDDNFPKTLEGNPLALDIPSEVLLEGELYVLKQQTTESFQTSMQNLMKLASKQSVFGLLLLYSLAMKKYYLPRYRGMLDDTDMSQAAVFIEKFETFQHSSEQKILMECLVGKRDFLCSHFMHGVESSFQQYMINSVIVSTAARLLSYCYVPGGESQSFLGMCLLKPMALKCCFLPGFSDSSNYISLVDDESVEFHKEYKFSLCKCNRRLLFRSQGAPFVCVVCGNEISEDQISPHHPLKKSLSAQASVGFKFIPQILSSVEILAGVSFHILHLLVKGCLLSSVALGIGKSSEIQEIIGEHLPEIDLSHHLESEIHKHWNEIKESLNLYDHDVGIILHSVIHRGSQMLFKEDTAFSTAIQREIWEKQFETHVLNIIDERLNTIHESVHTCNKLYELPQQSIEVVIHEANDIENTDKHVTLPTLFRVSVKPSRSDFLCQLWSHKDTYPFLNMVFTHERQLMLPKYMYDILQWHMAAVVTISYLFKRFECLKMTVREFHDSLQDLQKRKMSKRKFENFRSSWRSIKKALEDTEGFETLLSIDNETKLIDCLILDSDCDIFKTLSFLIDIQNDFIDLALKSSFTSKNLQFMLKDTEVACFQVVPVTDLKKEHLVDLTIDLDESLAQESNCGLAYGKGKQVFYDFQRIEKDLCINLLVGKAYLSLEVLPKIVFTDEVYRNFVILLADVHHSVPQEPLPSDVEIAFVKMTKDKITMSFELINYLDMVLTLLKKSKCDPQKPLTEFVKERNNILGRQFPTQYLPNPESRVKICHIICLHELLEELSVDRLMGSLADKYNNELESEMSDHFMKMPVSSIRKSEFVTKAMKRFIYRCIYMGDIDPEQPLLQFLNQESFWPESIFRNGKLKLEGKEEDVKDVIPPSVLVCHAVAAVSLLHQSIETQKQGEVRMDHVITSWKSSKGDGASKMTRKKKAVKKLGKS